MLATVLLILGGVLITTGVALVYAPAGLVVAGLLIGLLGWDLA